MADKQDFRKLFNVEATANLTRADSGDTPPPDDEDVGPCASIAKDKWVTALTIKHPKNPWQSFQYRGLATRSEYEPTRFWVHFVDDDEKWKIVVTGRNLERIYNLVIQHRLEWLRAADRDFAQDLQPIVLSILINKVEVEKK